MLKQLSRLLLSCLLAWWASGLFPLARAEEPRLLTGETPFSPQHLALLDDATLNAVCMIGPRVLYAVGEQGVIRKSEDAGQTWRFLPSPVTCRWHSLCFLTDRIGWIAGGNLTVDGRESRGCLLQTLDGGESWTVQSPLEMGMLHAVRFFDLQHGIVCGESTASGLAGIWRTSDGGKTWQGMQSAEPMQWRTGAFSLNGGGVVAGSRGRVALVGGNRILVDRSLTESYRGIRSLTLDETAAGWMVGDGGLVRYSPAGAAWQDPPGALPAELKTLYDFRAVARVEQSVWLAGHPGSAIWMSQDGGRTWQARATGGTVPLNSLHFADSLHGCAVGELGTILLTSDGGLTWSNAARQTRRLALLQFSPRASESSFLLTARYAGHAGYRVGIVALCDNPLAATNLDRVAEDLRLQQGVNLTGGHVGRASWALPLDLPELDLRRESLLARWNRSTDDQLADLVLSHLVRDLRVYRPDVVVIDLPPENDQASQLMRSALDNAIRAAGDSTWLVEQQQYAALGPWKVPRVFERSRIGRGGEVLLESDDYLAGLDQSARMAAGPAYLQLHGSLTALPSAESFQLVNRSDLPGPLRLADLFTGIILAPGGAARRATFIEESPRSQAGAVLAREQRNFSALVRTRLHDEQQAAQMIAQLNQVVGRSPGSQAVQQLLELAEQYRRNAQWDYYDAVLMQAIENYPDEPATGLAAVQLLQLWTSREMTQLRLSNRNTSVVSRQIDSARLSEELEAFLSEATEEPASQVIVPVVREESRAAALTPGSKLERSAWESTWQQRALVVYRFLERTSPELARGPDVQLPLASLYRDRGARLGVQGVFQQYLHDSGRDEKDRSLLQQFAEVEFWLQSRAGITPRRYLPCYAVSQAPYLDGLLSDECWQQADEIRLRVASRFSAAGLESLDRPIVMLGYDAEYFYLAGSFPRLPALPVELPRREGRRHDADLTGQDRLQIAIDLDRDYQSSLVLEVDQRGFTRDTCWLDAGWDPEWFVACQGDERHWRVELAIPLAELSRERPVRANETWGLSVSRILPGIGVQSWGEQQGDVPERASFVVLQFR